MSRTSHWPTIGLLWLSGVMAAAQLGKMASLMPAIRAELGLTLAGAGLTISLIETGGAMLGSIGGIVAGRFSGRAVLATGTALIVVAGLAAAAAPDAALLYAARLIESVGYLLVVLSAPSLIAMVAAPSERGAAMALWSTFVPIGLALGTVLSGLAVDVVSWRVVLVAWALLALVTLPGALRLHADTGLRHDRFALPPPALWWLALGFGCYTTLEVGVLGMLPAYLTEAWGFDLSTAGTIAGFTSAATIAGSFATARLLKSGENARRPLILIAIGLMLPALLSFVSFPPMAWAGEVSSVTVAAAVILANAVSGVVAAVAFARMPELLQRSGAPLSLVTAANGVFTQCGAAGSLIGPPLVGYVASRWDWSLVAPMIAALSVLSLAGFAVAETLASRRTKP